MAECRLVIIKRNGEDLTEQVLAPGTEWKIGKYVSNMCVFVTTYTHQAPTKQAHSYAFAITYLILLRGVNADIRVRIDGVEEEHGIIKVDNNGKVGKRIARLFEYNHYVYMFRYACATLVQTIL